MFSLLHDLRQGWRTRFQTFSRPMRPQNQRTKRRKKPSRAWIFETLEARSLMAGDVMGPILPTAEYFVAPGGDDWADGSNEHPFATIRRALDASKSGDTITLRNGVYEGGINIDIDNLTIRSAPGEWAVIESPVTQFNDGHANSVIRYGFDVEGGRLENLEIVGGYYYGVMFWDWWDSDWTAGSTHFGASGITLDGIKVHDTGADAIKITPGANDITIINSEIYKTGRRVTTSADGIDNNNGDRMIARGNYIHDIAGVGILTAGGSKDSLIEQNLIRNTAGAGINVGFYSEMEWMEPSDNPDLYLSINNVVRNNIVVDAGQAGVGIYGSKNPQVYNNTIVNAAGDAQAPLQFGFAEIWVGDNVPYHHADNLNPVVVNNIFTTAPDNDTRFVDIREGSIDPAGLLTLDYNLYYGTSTRGTLFIDRNLTGEGTPEQTFSQWKSNYGYDHHSVLADPLLDASWHLTALSPAIAKALQIAGLTSDFNGNPRLADPPAPDLGADEFNAGVNLAAPPAPYGAPSLEIDSRAYHDYEGKTIQVRVVRNGSVSDTVTVQYATLAGTAQAGQDYTSVAGILTFAPGETEKLVPLTLLGDNLPEGDEHLLFTLSNPTTDGDLPIRLGHQSAASLTIDDQQTPMTLTYATKWVSNDGSDVTGDGSEASPWKSLQFAADNVSPGDYVIVTPGQYWGMNMTRDGKPDARITFHAMPGVLIDEPDPEQHKDGINLEGADYVTIEGFSVANMPRAGLRSVNNNGVILRNNVSDHNTMWGILTGWSENIVVENNVVSRSQIEHGIYISNSADGAIIRNNIVWGNHDSGIQFNADGSLTGDGVHSNNLVEGNVIYENGLGGGAALNFDGFQDSIVRNNLLYNNHSTGIVLYVGFAADSSTNNLVENNTVIMAEDARWALLMTDGSSGNTIVNNILLNKNPSRGSMTVEANSLPAFSDFNVVQDLFQTNGANGSFSQWHTFSGGQDANSIIVGQGDVQAAIEQLFVDATNNDYHLTTNSPAVNAGAIDHSPAFDIYHHARPYGGRVDIGAFEAGTFAPSVQFEWQDVIGYEFVGMAEVSITRSGDTEGFLTVNVTSSPGSALASDYQSHNEQVVFQPGETRKIIRVFVTDDLEIESMETVSLQLEALAPSGQLLTDQTTLHIVSDDAWRPGQFQFESSKTSVDEAAETVIITVQRTDGSNGPASVDYTTALFTPAKQATWVKKHTDLLYPTDNDIPAAAGEDFVSQQGTLDFADGETTKTITISIVNDNWYEKGESFLVSLTNATNGAVIGNKSQARVHIDSDDAKQAGTFVWANTAYTVTEGNPTLNVTVNRINGGNVEASVRLYETGAGNSSTVNSAWSPSDYGSLPAILTFAPGEMSKTISIPIVDDSSAEIDEAFSVKLYAPTNDASVDASATTMITIKDNESTFYFKGATAAASSFEAVEGAGQLPVTIVRQGALTTPASVTISSSDWGSATPGVDFTPLNVTLQFAPGEVSKTVYVTLYNDSIVEAKESFPVNMSDAVGATQGNWTWSANIMDDDVASSPGKLEFSAATYSASEAGGAVNITVNRVGGSDGTVTVKYSTSDGATGTSSNQTAYAGGDYSSKSGTLTFAPAETSKVITIPITNDTYVEKNEYFSISLNTPGGGALLGSVAKAVVTILEDDSAIEFGTSNYTVNEAAGFVLLTIVRKGSTLGTTTVDLNISSGSAEAGKDFLKPLSNKVIFADGETEKTVPLQIIDDIFAEQDESLYLSLTNALGSNLGSSLWGNVKIISND